MAVLNWGSGTHIITHERGAHPVPNLAILTGVNGVHITAQEAQEFSPGMNEGVRDGGEGNLNAEAIFRK